MNTPSTDNGSLSYPALMDSHVFVLDCWYVYPTRNLIQHRDDTGHNRALEPRLMRLLCLLAASADAVVDREVIINTLWPRVVVNENSLTRAVSDLRRTLTPAGADRSTLIRTIPKRGYHLTQAPAFVSTAARPAFPDLSGADKITASNWFKRWTPSIAASFILTLALALHLGDDGQSDQSVAQLSATMQTPPTTFAIDGQQPGLHYDRVVDSVATPAAATTKEAATLPASLLRDDDSAFATSRLGDAPEWQGNPATVASLTQSILTPDGQLLAYVNYRNGISSLNLRPAMSEAEPWVAFTTDERIFHLQWSPLDAGILLTVGQADDNSDRASYLRLMLLDLETLTVQELYRRELPEEQRWTQGTGNLT